MSAWRVLFTEQTTTPHVVPVDDLREHEPEACWCRPTFKENTWVHNSMDRREEFEPDYEGVKRQAS